MDRYPREELLEEAEESRVAGTEGRLDESRGCDVRVSARVVQWRDTVRTADGLLCLRLECLSKACPEEDARLVVEDLREPVSVASERREWGVLTAIASSRKLACVVWSFLSLRTFSSVYACAARRQRERPHSSSLVDAHLDTYAAEIGDERLEASPECRSPLWHRRLRRLVASPGLVDECRRRVDRSLCDVLPQPSYAIRRSESSAPLPPTSRARDAMSKQALTLRATCSFRSATRFSTSEGRTERLCAVWSDEARSGWSCETARR